MPVPFTHQFDSISNLEMPPFIQGKKVSNKELSNPYGQLFVPLLLQLYYVSVFTSQ